MWVTQKKRTSLCSIMTDLYEQIVDDHRLGSVESAVVHVVVASAAFCKPCKTYKPLLQKAVALMSGVKLYLIDTQDARVQGLVDGFGIRMLPTTIVGKADERGCFRAQERVQGSNLADALKAIHTVYRSVFNLEDAKYSPTFGFHAVVSNPSQFSMLKELMRGIEFRADASCRALYDVVSHGASTRVGGSGVGGGSGGGSAPPLPIMTLEAFIEELYAQYFF